MTYLLKIKPISTGMIPQKTFHWTLFHPAKPQALCFGNLFEDTSEMPSYASCKTYGKIPATVAVDVLTEKLTEIVLHHCPYLLAV